MKKARSISCPVLNCASEVLSNITVIAYFINMQPLSFRRFLSIEEVRCE